MGKGGAGPVCFCLVSPGGGSESNCTTWTLESPDPHYVTRGARPPDHFQDSAMAESHCDPVACTVFPGLPPTHSLLDFPSAPPAPSSAHPSLPSENPASWVVAWSGVGEAAPYRMAMTWDMEADLCNLIPVALTSSSSSCVRAV